MDKFELQKLRDLPIEGVAERLGLQVRMHKCLCPFHDDHHASLTFSVRRNTFRCFACGASGSTIDLVMRHLNLGFKEACRWLGADVPSSIFPQPSSILHLPSSLSPLPSFDASRYARFFQRPWLSTEARHFLFDERKLDARVVGWCRLTSFCDRKGTHWLQIPYFDREGRLIGIQNRNLVSGSRMQDSGDANHQPRFRFPRGAQCSIYNLPVLNMLRPGEPLYITEGCSDCWAMLSSGHKAIAIPSATLLKPADVEQLATLSSQLSTPFHMYPDQDVPGERLFLQLQKLLPCLEHHQLPLGCKDYSDYYLRQKTCEP